MRTENIFSKLKSLPGDKKVLFFIIMAELLIRRKLNINTRNTYLINTVDLCWEWLQKKTISGNDLYLNLENLDDTGILSIMQDIKDEDELSIWICIAEILAFTIHQAYKHQNEIYLPQTIECVDLKETLDNVMVIFRNQVENSDKVLNKIYKKVQRTDVSTLASKTEFMAKFHKDII